MKITSLLLLLLFSQHSHSSEQYTNRFLTASILEGIYGPSISNILEENILSKPYSFGGPCSLMEKIEIEKEGKVINKSSRYYCRKGISESKVSPYSTDFKTRFALTKKVCDQVAEDHGAQNYLMSKLSKETTLTDKVSSLVTFFYPELTDRKFSSEIIKSLIESNTLRFQFLSKIDFTKDLFLDLNESPIISKSAHLLCISEKWQRIKTSHNDIQKYIKCHKLLTQKNPNFDSNRVKRIKEGKLSANNACTELIESANFTKSNQIKNPQENIEGSDVLRTIQAFHNSWFPNYMAYMADDSPILYDIVELEEPALFITNAFFNSEFNYRSILNGSTSLKGIRSSKFKPDFLITAGSDENIKIRDEYEVKITKEKSTNWSPHPLDRGRLIGITSIKDRNILPAHSNQLFFPVFSNTPVDIHKSIGGGILGSNSYILFNNGRPHGNISDGKKVMMRAYSKNIIRDLLCRDLPVIDPEDSIRFINKNSKLSWSQDKNCMSCHATMDTMAGLLRNAELIINDVKDQGSSHIKFHRPIQSEPKAALLFDTVKNYHQTNPSGSFVYRDIENNFINTRVNNLDQLGLEISKTRDFYACATTRYFNFLTGRDIPISSLSSLEEKDLKTFMNQQISLFQKEQDLQKLIMRIISSKWF